MVRQAYHEWEEANDFRATPFALSLSKGGWRIFQRAVCWVVPYKVESNTTMLGINFLDYPICLTKPRRMTEISSWHEHIPFAMFLMEMLKPDVFVELGVHFGDSYCAFCQAVQEGELTTRCYAVDTWHGDAHANHYGPEVLADLRMHHDPLYGSFSRLVQSTFDEAVRQFGDGTIDLLHVDGFHTYEAVRHDVESWLPKMSARGVILLHHTQVRERGFGVWKFWDELTHCYPNFEFLHGHGLGVLAVGKEYPQAFEQMLAYSESQKRVVRHWFHELGRRLTVEKRYVQLTTERDGQIAALNHALSERDGQIASLNQAVTEYQNSRSWRVTKPLRLIGDQLRKISSFVHTVFRNSDSMNARWALSKRFDTAWYLKQNPDVARSGMDPYGHYVTYGKAEGRQPAPNAFLVRMIKRAQLIYTALLVAVRHRGGIKLSLSRAWSVFKREGWNGVRRRAIFLLEQSAGFNRNDYAEWIRRYDTLTDETHTAMRARMDAFAHKPLISVVMPTYNPKPEWLSEAIESVRKQIYPYWELCIADDASPDKATRSILERYANEDPRIKIAFREVRGKISAASNSALGLATGEWIALLDHDDLLAEHALFWVADAINKNPDVRLIYSDEDKIDEASRRLYPYFKCDWNVDLFYSHNLITHLGVYSAELLRKIGGFREGLEGAQDYDLALRCTEHIESHQIHHIPRVLYHWRIHAESTAQSSDAKPYAMLAGERALNEHLKRLGIEANAELVGFWYRVRYALPSDLPLVSLIIPTHNGSHLIRQCVESILEKTTYSNYEILIIDNRSDDPETLAYFKALKGDSKIRVVRDDRPFNYSAINNAAVKLARGEVIGLVNNDIVVISPDWLSEMVSHTLRAGVGAVGARLWYPNETLQHGGVILGVGGVAAGHAHKGLPRHQYGYSGRASFIQSFSAVTAACLVIRKSIYEEVGGLNETDLQVACNDVDFCLRVREAGYRNVWTPYAELYHHESATRGYENTSERQARFAKEVTYMKQRWGDLLLNDPAYSPNLTLNYEDFSFAWPPRVEVVGHPREKTGQQDTQQTLLNRVDQALIRNHIPVKGNPYYSPHLTLDREDFSLH